jgi:hypothetical protein
MLIMSLTCAVTWSRVMTLKVVRLARRGCCALCRRVRLTFLHHPSSWLLSFACTVIICTYSGAEQPLQAGGNGDHHLVSDVAIPKKPFFSITPMTSKPMPSMRTRMLTAGVSPNSFLATL